LATPIESVQVGDRLPELRLPLLGGEQLDFASLRGTRILLFFWGSW
jgi:peroxiredoxin